MSNGAPISPDLLAKLQQLGWVSPPAGQPAPAPTAPATPAPLPPTPGLTATRPKAPPIYLPTTAPPGPRGHATPPAAQPYQYKGPEIAESGPSAAPVFAQPQPPPQAAPPINFGGAPGGPVATPERDVSIIGPTERKEGAEARAAEKAAIGKVGQAEVNANEGEAGALEEIAQKQGEDQVAAQAAELPRQKALQDQEAEYARLQKDAAEGRVEYDRRSFGARALGAVFMGLNAFGNAIQRAPGAPNLAKEIIDQSIERDFREQLEAKGEKAKAADRGGDLLERMRTRFKDERAAESGFRAMRWQEYAAQAQAVAKRAQSPALEARAGLFQAQADLETSRWDMETHKFFPAGIAGGGDSNAKKAQELAAELVRQGDTPEHARQAAAATFGITPAAGVAGYLKPEGGAEKVQTPGDVPIPGSTNWNPLRHVQGTQAYADVNTQNRYNAALATAVVAKLGRGAERSPEMVKRFAGAYEIHPGDSQATIDMKVAAARRDFPGFAASTGGPSAADLGATPLGGK